MGQGGSLPHSSTPQEVNTEKLTAFVNTLNGKDGTGSHLVTVPPGPSLADALISSPILAGEGGAMLGLGASDFEFGVDPSADPELALVSKRGPQAEPSAPALSCADTRTSHSCFSGAAQPPAAPLLSPDCLPPLCPVSPLARPLFASDGTPGFSQGCPFVLRQPSRFPRTPVPAVVRAGH